MLKSKFVCLKEIKLDKKLKSLILMVRRYFKHLNSMWFDI